MNRDMYVKCLAHTGAKEAATVGVVEEMITRGTRRPASLDCNVAL